MELELELLKKQLIQKDLEIFNLKERTYDEIEKYGHIYILKIGDYYKIGKTRESVKKRKQQLNTSYPEEIEIIFDFKTSNSDLLEKLVHYILDKYRITNNREFFRCNVDYMKLVIEKCGNNLDRLKSTNHNITQEELECILNNKFYNINLYSDISKSINEQLKIVENENIKLSNMINEYKKNNIVKNNTSEYFIREINNNISILKNSKKLYKYEKSTEIEKCILENYEIGDKKSFVKLKDIKTLLKKNNIKELENTTLKYMIENLFNGDVEYYNRKQIENNHFRNIFLNLRVSATT